MYGHSTIPRASSDINGDFPSPDMTTVSPFPLSPLLPPNILIPHDHHHHHHYQVTELDSVHSSSSSGGGGGGGGYCSGYNSPSSLVSCCTTQKSSLLQRSISSHSLQKNNGFHCHFNDPVRRVFSTGDLQRINMVQHSNRSGSPLSNESNAIIEGMSKACRYSPEEKKERIERYRSKRNQRNFNKKIKYACRKTLADSRPRIRGRFARNEEIENNSQAQWSHISGEEDENDDDNWINFLDAFQANLIP